MNKFALRRLSVALVTLFSGAVSAAGYQALESSASGVATSYAGSAAVTDNASVGFYNPAGLTQLSGIQVSTGVVGLKANVENSLGGGNAGESQLRPNLYLAMQLTPDWAFGLGVARPSGVQIEYDAGWAGAATALKTDIQTVNVSPAVAYRLNDKVSLGFGLNYQKLDAELTAAGSSLIGDDSAWGWNAGALFTLSPAMKVGVAYRSGYNHTLPGNASLKLPGTLTLSVWQQVSDRWEAMGDLSFSNANRIGQSAAAFTGGADYNNAWRLAWGAAYKQSEQLKLKFGFAYDKSATRNGNLSLRAPEANAFWLSAGLQWNAGRAGKVDLGYAYKFSREAEAVNAGGRYDTSGHLLGLQYSAGF